MIPTWQEEAKKDPDWDSGMITNRMIQEKMQAEIDTLRKELALQKLYDIGQAIERELTDEELLKIYKKCLNLKNKFKDNEKRTSYFNFAKAVLKKANENEL